VVSSPTGPTSTVCGRCLVVEGKGYLIAFGKPAGHREVAPREFDVHSRWKPAREQKGKEGEEEEE